MSKEHARLPGGVCRVWQAQRSDSGSEDMLGMGGGRGGRGGQGGESGNSRGQSAGHGDWTAQPRVRAMHASFGWLTPRMAPPLVGSPRGAA